jgi:hypothetical protein
MRHSLKSSVVAGLTLVIVGCGSASTSNEGSTESAVRSLTRAEALEDFGQIASAFRGLYGALVRKEARYQFNFESKVEEFRARITLAGSEAEYRALFQEFIALFEDPHVSLSAGLPNDASRSVRLPFSVMPVESTFVVYAVDAALGAGAPVVIGDELLSIDGAPAMQLAQGFSKYISVANPLASMHTAAARLTGRPTYLARGIQPDAPVVLRFRSPDGSERDVTLAWKEGTRLLPVLAAPPHAGESTRATGVALSETAAEVTIAELSKTGARVPFFMTALGRQSLVQAAEVKPSAEALAKFELTSEDAEQINYFAMTYSLGEKRVLLVRLPSYTPPDGKKALDYLRALFDDQRDQVDALVFDETHNPGGSIDFAEGIIGLLAKGPYRGYVQQMHADRKWISSFAQMASSVRQDDPTDPAAQVFEDQARQIDAAYSSGKPLSPALPFFAVSPMHEPDPAHWSKPALVLVDELSVSCADFVPLIVKANGFVTLFGQTTMGGGGNVERVATLTNSQTSLSISRGLGTVYDPTGTYPEADFIEDNGVPPNVMYSHTLADFRGGYVGYINAFNAELVRQLAPREASAR